MNDFNRNALKVRLQWELGNLNRRSRADLASEDGEDRASRNRPSRRPGRDETCGVEDTPVKDQGLRLRAIHGQTQEAGQRATGDDHSPRRGCWSQLSLQSHLLTPLAAQLLPAS